jgi:glycerol-1-phosphate dehydrogenase [NAD(P)+]
MFKETDFLDTAIKQSKEKYISREELAIQLEKLKIIWPQLKDRLTKQLVPSDEVRQNLMAVGAPVEPEQIGISKERMKTSFLRAQFIRSRFTILDIAVRTGYMEQWLKDMF